MYGSGVVRIVRDAERGMVALFDGAARIEVGANMERVISFYIVIFMTVLTYVIVCLFHCLIFLYYYVYITALMCNVIMLTCCFCC